MKKYVVYLEWPERCFRVTAEDLKVLSSKLPRGSLLKRVRSERALLKELPEATHVLTWHFREEWFDRAPRLQVLATPAAGKELLPAKGPAKLKIHFGSFHGAIMGESVAAAILAHRRGFFKCAAAPEKWPRVWLSDKCESVRSSLAVIAGYGHVGRGIGKVLQSLGIVVKGLTHAECDALKAGKLKLPKETAYFILALPANEGTENFLDRRLIAKLPRQCFIVNVGRGNAVDEAALAAALKKGRLAGAYLDVVKAEGRSCRLHERGELDLSWTNGVDNLVIMPHASAFSNRYMREFILELDREGYLK